MKVEFLCDSGENSEPCDFCKQAQNESVLLSNKIVNFIKSKDLIDSQQVQAVILAALTSIELIVGREKLLPASDVIANIVVEWLSAVAGSHSVDLKQNNIAANIVNGNKTLN